MKLQATPSLKFAPSRPYIIVHGPSIKEGTVDSEVLTTWMLRQSFIAVVLVGAVVLSRELRVDV